MAETVDADPLPLEELSSEEDVASKMTDKTKTGKARKSPVPDRQTDRRRRKPLMVKEEEAAEGAATPGGGGSGRGGSRGVTEGGGGKGAQDDGKTGAFTPTDEDFVIPKTTGELTVDMQKIRDDLNREIQRRQDLEDELDIEKAKISDNAAKLNANTKAAQKILQVLAREGEHSDSNRALVIKKETISNAQFFW